MFLDVDHFKVVNDSRGHSFGDDLLRQTAQRIAAVIRSGDTVARFGGDEFVIVCDDVSILEMEATAERVLAVMRQPFLTGHHETNVSCSLGLVIADDDATPESLLRDSDVAMYRAKAHGRGRMETFDKALRSKVEQRLATASALHRALERQELSVYYQPIVDLSSGAVVSAEALVRWEHPERGPGQPVGVRPGRRRDGPHRAHRRVGAGAGVRTARRVAALRAGDVGICQPIRTADACP